MEIDPDYAFDISQNCTEDADIARQFEDHAREAVKNKIRSIIKKQFMEEINTKEKEVALITERLSEARHMLDRLRACVVASYYASSFAKPQEKHTIESGAAHHPAIQNILRKAATAVLSRNAPHEQPRPKREIEEEAERAADSDAERECESKDIDGITKISESSSQDDDHVIKTSQSTSCNASLRENLGGRHRIKKKIIVGNVSKYIPPDKREGNDKSTHKWMVYVRGSSEEPRIDHFVRKVWFFLHPSYRPNDLVEISEAPFHLTRRGWGEFPIRVQLHFCDPRNRRVDIIHNLCLDRTYTGLQTLGSETVCEVELDRSTIDPSVENLLNQPVDRDVTNDESLDHRSTSCVPSLKDEQRQNVFDSDPSPVIYNLLRDMISTVERKVRSSVEEEGTVGDVSSRAVREQDFSMSSPTTERRRRRRRGDSCTVTDADENEKTKKSMSMMFLCADEERVDDIEGSNGTSNAILDNNSIASSDTAGEEVLPENIPDLKLSLNEISNEVKTEVSFSSGSAFEPQPSLVLATSAPSSAEPTPSCHSVPSSPRNLNDSSATLVTKTSPPAERPRSLSVDDVTPTSSSVTLPVIKRKLVRISKSAGTKETAKVAFSAAGNKKPPSPVVLCRPRASSAGYSQKFAQTNKGNVTILTPLSSKSVTNMISGQKRSIGCVSANSSGKLLLNLVPEKQRKVAAVSKATDVILTQSRTSASGTEPKLSSSWSLSSSGKINLTIAGSKQQTSGESSLQLGSSGSAMMSSKVKVENASLSSKQYVFKNTKQGVYVVGQSSSTKEPIRSSPVGNLISAICPSQDSIEVKTRAKKSTDSKPVNQQQLLSMKALKNAILGSGVDLNRPVQIKIEKPGNSQSFGQLKNNQQFVLTTVTNEQGKQQLALVSTDRLKQVCKSKAAVPGKAAQGYGGSAAPIPVKFEWNNQSGSPWLITKLNDAENLSYHQIVGKRILQHNINDMVADALPLAVKYVPLVAGNRNMSFLPFCAKTEAEFLDWNIGKQRAAEMLRASLLQKILHYVKSRCSNLKQASVPSKRFLINWCLTRGHSVFTDEFEAADANSEGQPPNVKVESSLTSCDQLLSKLTNDSSDLHQARVFCSDDIDVVSVASSTRDVKSEPGSSEATSSSRLQFIHSDLMRAVDAMSQEVEVKLKNVPIDSVANAPLCHVILAKALELFTSDITREALACALMRRDGEKRILRVLPEQIECRDVAEVVMKQDRFQVLSDRYMGVSSHSWS